jgi:type II secretory pathway pseudopilin PulG
MKLKAESRSRAHQRGERGYVLLTLMLAVALIIIFAAAIVPTIKFQIERDREEEMIHRGVQYARAIRIYYKKFGRYPTRLEDLESSNNLRFLRKRYKDPITGKDFKLLHFGEVKLAFSGGIGGGTIPGANPIGSAGGASGTGGLGQISTFGTSGGLGASSNSSFGQNQQGTNNPQGTEGSDASQSSSEQAGSGQPGMTPVSEMTGGNSSSQGSSDQPLIASGPIVGVASSSKKATIREFNHKKKYNEWQFIYDPGTDSGGLLMTPYQPQLQGFAQQGTQNPNGQSNAPSGFGTGNSFGISPSGVQNNPSSPSSPGTTDQQNNPQQQ